MNRKCPCCKMENTFYKMKNSRTVIYCSLCLHELIVPEHQASWYSYDDGSDDEDITGDDL